MIKADIADLYEECLSSNLPFHRKSKDRFLTAIKNPWIMKHLYSIRPRRLDASNLMNSYK